MRYVIFSRVSGKNQDTEMQIMECLDYINSKKKEGDVVIKFDEKVKSTRLEIKDRPVLKEMLEFVSKGDVLVVYKLNRLARGHEMASIYHDLCKKSVTLVSLYEKEINEMIIHAYALVAAAERKNIRENTISGLRKKQKKMEKVGTAWYGYATDPDKIQKHKEKCHSFGKPYLLIPKDDEQKQVSLMVDLHQRGRSYGEIVHELETRGFRNRKGNPVQKSTVWRILKRLETQNPAPTGLSYAQSH